jgi:hypothetical protein
MNELYRSSALSRPVQLRRISIGQAMVGRPTKAA